MDSVSVISDLFDGSGQIKPLEAVPAPEFGDGQVVHICGLGMGGALRLNALEEAGANGVEIAKALFPLCICRPTGEPFFPAGNDLTADQQARLDRIPLTLVMRVVERATARMGEVKEAAKKPSPETAG